MDINMLVYVGIVIGVMSLIVWLLSSIKEESDDVKSTNSKYNDENVPLPDGSQEYYLFQEIDDLIHLINNIYEKFKKKKIELNLVETENFNNIKIRYEKLKANSKDAWHSRVSINAIIELFNIRLFLVKYRNTFIEFNYPDVKSFIVENDYNYIKYQSIEFFALYIEKLDASSISEIAKMLDKAAEYKQVWTLKENTILENMKYLKQEDAFEYVLKFYKDAKIYNNQEYTLSLPLNRLPVKMMWCLSIVACQIKELNLDGEILWYYLARGFSKCNKFSPEKDAVKFLASRYIDNDFNKFLKKTGKALIQATKKVKGDNGYDNEINRLEKIEKMYKDKLITNEERKKMRSKILGID